MRRRWLYFPAVGGSGYITFVARNFLFNRNVANASAPDGTSISGEGQIVVYIEDTFSDVNITESNIFSGKTNLPFTTSTYNYTSTLDGLAKTATRYAFKLGTGSFVVASPITTETLTQSDIKIEMTGSGEVGVQGLPTLSTGDPARCTSVFDDAFIFDVNDNYQADVLGGNSGIIWIEGSDSCEVSPPNFGADTAYTCGSPPIYWESVTMPA